MQQIQEAAAMKDSIKLVSEQSAGLIRLMPNPAAGLTSDYKSGAERSNSIASSFVQFDPNAIQDISIAGSASQQMP